jgi:Bardet-Biedl syndrome 5 protein
LRESKFGRALVLETFAKSGGYILGFRIDPQDKINAVFQEMQSLFQIYSTGPIFGVDFSVEAEAPGECLK